MNKYQARARMTAGEKITHRHFTDTEYLFEKDGRVMTEDGYQMPNTTYNPWSANAAADGWEVFKDQNEEPC